MIVDRMTALMQEVSIIGDIRNKGLMLGIEFVDPHGQKDQLGSLPQSGVIAAKVQKSVSTTA
jgi:diaminobutyrate-2-oxoglutarate transaminase